MKNSRINHWCISYFVLLWNAGAIPDFLWLNNAILVSNHNSNLQIINRAKNALKYLRCPIVAQNKKREPLKFSFLVHCISAMRFLAESNRRTRFCRPLPSHSAKEPKCHFYMSKVVPGFSRQVGTSHSDK